MGRRTRPPLACTERSSAVICYRHPFVICGERVLRGEQCAGGFGMVDAGIKVGVIRHGSRTMHNALCHRDEKIRSTAAGLLSTGTDIKCVADPLAQFPEAFESQRK